MRLGTTAPAALEALEAMVLKDQLRMLVLGNDPDFAKLAAAEMWKRGCASPLFGANGDEAEIGYDDAGGACVRVRRCCDGGWPYWAPPTGTA